ncbi:MAG: acyl carrier protein [Phycisphaerae bacterium]|nr:acyl carrier protein [Phycisphaerae bacterium]
MSDFEAGKSEILDWVAEAIGKPVEQIDTTQPLTDIGMDSLDAVHMVALIESIIQQDLPEDIIQQVKCLDDVFELMQKKLAAG